MGLRGLEIKNPHDMQRERREEHGDRGGQQELERRSREKVQEILRDQNGDMSAHTGSISPPKGDCETIAAYPIERIMSGRVAVLSFDDTLLTVHGIFASVKFRHLPVVDEHGHIIGIISDRDVLRMTSPFFGTINEQKRDVEIMSRRVGMIMTRNPVCIPMGATLLEAVRLMNGKKISCLPVVEGNTARLAGIITWKDVVRAFVPGAFNMTGESNRLKTGVHINPESSESVRLRVKAAESARMRAVAESAAADMPDAAPERRPVGDKPDPDRLPLPKDPTDTAVLEKREPEESDHISLSSEPKILAQHKLADGQRMRPLPNV
jgi:acetoin utilization protein AcuB